MLNLKEVKDKILQDKDWQSRSLDIEIFHFEMMISRKKWSIRKTAKALELCASTVCEDLMLSKFMLKNPNLSTFRRRKDAVAYVRSLK